ncbi:8073_t:CDS:1, partial [Funneliformis caledonium]
NYLEKLPSTEKYKKRVKCFVKISGQPCGHIMKSDGSTRNFIFHLAKHHITRDSNLSQNNKNVDETQNISAKKNQLDRKFVGIIIKDDQLISIRNDEGFHEFVKELDPLYELPSNKKVRELLVKSYNFCKKEIIHLFEQ